MFVGRHRGRPLVIEPYHGFGSRHGLWLRGRVVEDGGVTPLREGASAWENLANTYRRFRAHGIGEARVEVHVGEVTRTVTTTARGFFDLALEPEHLPPADDDGWVDVEMILREPAVDDPPTATGRILCPPGDVDFVVVSDIDDTVLRTWAFDKLRMLRLMLFENAHGRLPFPGVAAFYRALRGGPDGQGHNPVVYVSSSAWNIYDLLHDFLRLNDLPDGPLLLRDMLFTRASLLGGSRHDHKLDRIGEICAVWPEHELILIGDSGQHDPELYAQVVERHPGRVRAIYLRDVLFRPGRQREIEALAEQVAAHGVEMRLVADTAEAAEHAVAQGWIPAESLPAIEEHRDHDAQSPLPDALAS